MKDALDTTDLCGEASVREWQGCSWQYGNTQSFDRSRPETVIAREPFPKAFLSMRPENPFELDADRLMSNISCQKGSRARPFRIDVGTPAPGAGKRCSRWSPSSNRGPSGKGVHPVGGTRSNPFGRNHSSQEAHRCDSRHRRGRLREKVGCQTHRTASV